jgi:hypothetical protein
MNEGKFIILSLQFGISNLYSSPDFFELMKRAQVYQNKSLKTCRRDTTWGTFAFIRKIKWI